MKKHKINYRLQAFGTNRKRKIVARREISYEIRLATQLLLDELCFNWNKSRLEAQINNSIDASDREAFLSLSEQYQSYVKE
ncbi:IDEAL domain-containing protein [Sediminibacillus dalangtanensis]|uniref:IDEAL domain-containing protein n=1 Tax=Sediminibacillus dalangtanensis TaxID=2729421 RepID=A0ABX7VW81_9BACI|nr:IDEAL domain-containing protein [Sediminibacillus dalangtanensis]QTM98592.1 IDEAL domain-containing protein [Sediminibacillus dalangtanensis]